MINSRDIIAELERLRALAMLVETYKVIAANSMQRIRNSVLANRDFHLGLYGIFREVRWAHWKQSIASSSKKNKSVNEFQVSRAHGGKTVFVYLSANTGLYGDIITKTFGAFMRAVRMEKPQEIVIIGRVGVSLFAQEMPGKRYTYFDFPDTKVSYAELSTVTKHLSRFERVVVFHGAFRNLFLQEAISSSVSGAVEAEQKEPADAVTYLFEPSLETIANFFESEIFASLLEETFHESRLAKVASRLVLLDRATSNVDSAIKQSSFAYRRAHHRKYNRKQQDSLSGVSLWI